MRHRTSGTNPFLALSYIILGVAIAGCFGVFGYQYYLEGVAKSKANKVIVAQNSIDQATVTEFIRLRDRFTAADDILNRHIGLSQFFDVLESLTLQGVRFNSMKLTVAEDRTAIVNLAGSAKSFNALAAQSAQLASDKRIKRAIFSGINAGTKDTNISFSLDAVLDPSLVVLSGVPRASGGDVAPAAPVTPSASASTTSGSSATTLPGSPIKP